MKTLFKIGVGLASVACTMMAVPQVSFAVEPSSSQQEALAVHDVSLANGGVLKGQIITSSGQTRAKVPVILGQRGKELAKATTNANGEFAFKGVPSGVYHVSAGTQGGMYRVWSEQTAPPTAKTGVMIVNNEEVVRGQLGEWLLKLTRARKHCSCSVPRRRLSCRSSSARTMTTTPASKRSGYRDGTCNSRAVFFCAAMFPSDRLHRARLLSAARSTGR